MKIKTTEELLQEWQNKRYNVNYAKKRWIAVDKNLEYNYPKWKIPGRMFYANNFIDWIKETIWCHIILNIYPNASNTGENIKIN